MLLPCVRSTVKQDHYRIHTYLEAQSKAQRNQESKLHSHRATALLKITVRQLNHGIHEYLEARFDAERIRT